MNPVYERVCTCGHTMIDHTMQPYVIPKIPATAYWVASNCGKRDCKCKQFTIAEALGGLGV